jgi:four helix bundle protein
MKEYSMRRNLNRGYMKLDVWHKAIELYRMVWRLVNEAKLDFKLRSQIADAAQSVSANIAEGYSRRSINEYMQHLYISLGSLSETLSRTIAFLEAGQITNTQFEEQDALHYELMLRKRVHIAPDGAFARLLSMKFYKHATPACPPSAGKPAGRPTAFPHLPEAPSGALCL